MRDSPSFEPESDFVCDCGDDARSSCAGEPFFKKHEDKGYCVLHFPGKEKSLDFERAFQRKLERKEFNFRGVWFPQVSFEGVDFGVAACFDDTTFSGEANFSEVTFNFDAPFRGANFCEEADFIRAHFRGDALFLDVTFTGEANFLGATFDAPASFRNVTFGAEVVFSDAYFNGEATFVGSHFCQTANFYRATFKAEAKLFETIFSEQAFFEQTSFEGRALFFNSTFEGDANFGYASFTGEATFGRATFVDHARFEGSGDKRVFKTGSQLNLADARAKVPEHISFHNVFLRPHWFVDIDARKFDFTNVGWDQRTIDEEIKSLQERKVSSPHHLLSIACRHLSVNAEDNHRYEEASEFRFMAMDARRREKWRGFPVWKLSWWYWLASGYGERMARALVVLLGILCLFALLYHQVGFVRWEPRLASEPDTVVVKRDEVGTPLEFGRALAYSAGVMMLQKPEPRPATRAAQGLVILETILGPVQAALLALAIRRKFMR